MPPIATLRQYTEPDGDTRRDTRRSREGERTVPCVTGVGGADGGDQAGKGDTRAWCRGARANRGRRTRNERVANDETDAHEGNERYQRQKGVRRRRRFVRGYKGERTPRDRVSTRRSIPRRDPIRTPTDRTCSFMRCTRTRKLRDAASHTQRGAIGAGRLAPHPAIPPSTTLRRAAWEPPGASMAGAAVLGTGTFLRIVARVMGARPRATPVSNLMPTHRRAQHRCTRTSGVPSAISSYSYMPHNRAMSECKDRDDAGDIHLGA